MAEVDLICPTPLVKAASDVHYTWYVYGDCVVPCPTIEYTSEEWRRLTDTVRALALAALVLSFLSFVSHAAQFRKYYIQCMFIGGFLLNAAVTTAFFQHNRDDEVVCDGPAHFVKGGAFCIFQAAAFIFSFLWVEIWSVVFVYDLYLHVTFAADKRDVPRRRARYTLLAVTVTATLTMAPLLADNLGFDPEANMPMCVYLISEDSRFFWFTFFMPLCLLIAAAFAFAMRVGMRINSLFVQGVPGVGEGGCEEEARRRLLTDGGPAVTVTVLGEEDSGEVDEVEEEDEDENEDDWQSEEEEQDEDYYEERDPRDYKVAASTSASAGAYESQEVKREGEEGERSELDGSSSCLGSLGEGAGSGIGGVPLGSSADSVHSTGSAPACYSVLSQVSSIMLSSPTQGQAQGQAQGQSVHAQFSIAGHSKDLDPQTPSSGNSNSSSIDQWNSQAARGSGGSELRNSAQRTRRRPHARRRSSLRSTGSAESQQGTVSSAAKRGVLWLLPPAWVRYLSRTWRYNGLAIVFVLVFCATSLCVAPMLLYLYAFTWDRSVDAATDFAECLMQASVASLTDPSVPQTQAGVDAYAHGLCGTVPRDRPLRPLMYFVLVWASGYGIIPALVFGFAGYTRKLVKQLRRCCRAGGRGSESGSGNRVKSGHGSGAGGQ